ncbi:MAG: hypothetical protein ABII82_20235 [Verrucomicrobiota bacterium]
MSSLGAQGRYETPDLPEVQPVMERFRADWPVLSKPAYLAEPKGIAWPVEVSQEDQYRWFGLYMALPEESRKVMRSSRRLFREMGMDPSTLGQMEYSNIRIVPISARAEDGKLTGDVEVWASYETTSSTENTINMGKGNVTMTTISKTETVARGIYRMIEDEHGPRAVPVVVARKTRMRNTSRSSDPVMQRNLDRAAKNNATPWNTHVQYIADIKPLTSATFLFLDLPEFTARPTSTPKMSRQLMSMLMIEDNERDMRSLTYTGRHLTSVAPFRDGKQHGDQFVYMADFTRGSSVPLEQMPGMENARKIQRDGISLIEMRTTWRDGQIVRTAGGRP